MPRKAAKTIKVTEKLGLKPMPKKPTVKAYQERIKELQKKIASGKFRGHLLHRCHSYIWSANHKIRKLKGEKPLRNRKDTAQLSLPGFLRSQDLVKIEELIANRVNRELAKVGKKVTTKKKASRKAA